MSLEAASGGADLAPAWARVFVPLTIPRSHLADHIEEEEKKKKEKIHESHPYVQPIQPLRINIVGEIEDASYEECQNWVEKDDSEGYQSSDAINPRR